VCFYDEKTASRALIEQRWMEGWVGEVHIATKRGQADGLLQRLIELVESDRISLGAHPTGKNVIGVDAKAEAREAPDAKADEVPVCPAQEPSRALTTSPRPGVTTPQGRGARGCTNRIALLFQICSSSGSSLRRARLPTTKQAPACGWETFAFGTDTTTCGRRDFRCL
jgi:hypothetical protein